MSIANDQVHTAPTLFLLMAQYNGRTVVPLDQVCGDFFGHLTVGKLIRKALRGDIARLSCGSRQARRPNAAYTSSTLPPISTSAELQYLPI